ncbi:TPA: hypothetical protein HA244_05655 [Candidatus Micrarchaeota archaeon]|nr:hypothetical protein [Candidatus Micrarchaeota archaeon]
MTAQERRKYVLTSDRDLKILEACKRLERKKLSKAEKQFVELIKSQLEKDWRTPLLKFLNALIKKTAPKGKGKY